MLETHKYRRLGSSGGGTTVYPMEQLRKQCQTHVAIRLFGELSNVRHEQCHLAHISNYQIYLSRCQSELDPKCFSQESMHKMALLKFVIMTCDVVPLLLINSNLLDFTALLEDIQ